MKFLQEHPNFKSYDDSKYHTKDMPREIIRALEGVIPGMCCEVSLNEIVNILFKNIPHPLTSENAYPFLIDQLDYGFRELQQNKFNKLMDAILEISEQLGIIEEFNEIFEENDFGYYIEKNFLYYSWVLREEVDNSVQEDITNAIQVTKGICEQTQQHLYELINGVREGALDGLRSRKDAIRDAVSAMESFMKSITNEADIKSADKKLRGDQKWGDTHILKDGILIWKRIHEGFPDVRHGNPDITDISIEDAVYWIERIMTFISYLAKKYNQV
ncbi:hypothetical protein [Clostridium sp. DJ247]|uniref:hypothetical protein n=1 Tax=Clostridium sp. DJ247 TaxID=2726188 RepID=UPI0016234EDB|nr:hypothetical protein [Clostridium sp. DJ247]MBC2579380.1 hypothetical protein [Clostridium sp. DJ247]